MLSPSNDNAGKDIKGFIQEGTKNTLSGGSSAVGQRSADYLKTTPSIVPDHMEGVEVSRRDFLTGNISGPSADGQGIDQRRG